MRTMSEILQGEDLVSFLNSCENNFKKFAERVIGLEMQDFHLEWIEAIEKYNKIAIMAPSGFGKTTTCAIAYPLWKCWFNEHHQVLIVSNSLPQSTRVIDVLRETIDENELLQNMKPKNYQLTWTKQVMTFENRSMIKCRPYSMNIKGEQVDLIFCDEAASYRDTDKFFDYVVTRSVSKKGKIAVVSTPESPADLMAQLKANRGFFYKAYPALTEIGGKIVSIWPDRFSVDYLMKTKRIIGESLFEKNYMVNPQAQAERPLFPLQIILDCCDDHLSFKSCPTQEGSLIFMGCDFAIASGPKSDWDVYIVGEKIGNIVTLLHAERHKGFPIQAKVQRLKELYEQYKIQTILLDESGIGKAVLDQLRENGIPTKGFDFSSKNRTNYLIKLRVMLESKAIVIPNNAEDAYTKNFADKLLIELNGYNEIKDEIGGGTTKYVPRGHDDCVMALALLAYGSSQQKQYQNLFASG